jgi:hypothetical protein
MWEGLKNTIGKTWNNPYVSSFRDYNQQGALFMTGFEPRRGGGAGVPAKWTGYNTMWTREAGQFIPDPIRKIPVSGSGARMAMSGLGAVGSAWHVYSGYQEGGIFGAKDALVWEMAVASAATRFAYGTLGSSGVSGMSKWSLARMAQIGMKSPGSKIVFGGGAGMMSGMFRVAGAGVGATIGQSLLGTPGAFIGSYIGAAPIRFAATHPILAAGTALVGITAAAGAAAVKGGTAVVRAGAAHRRAQRSIDTSGSMAAFMTQNAHTMRARAVQAMHKSHLNARSALGQEAGFMHMPSKNYHSRYR